MKITKWNWIKCVAIPLATGSVAAFLTMGGMKAFQFMKQPPLSPPQWLFPVVWTILYVLMGIASCKVKYADVDEDSQGHIY